MVEVMNMGKAKNKKVDREGAKKGKGAVPSTQEGQNLGHNSKKEALGPNTQQD